MIYLHHDFYSNFASGTSADGNSLTLDLFANEISDMIVNNTDNFVNALKKAGVNVDVSIPDEMIVDRTLSAMKDNEKVVKAIGFAIAENKSIISTEKGTSVDWKNVLNSFVIGISPATKEITKNEESMQQAKDKIMRQIVAKADMLGNYPRTIWISKSGSSAIFWILGLAALGIAGYFFFQHIRKKPYIEVAMPPVTPPITPLTPPIAP